MDAKLLSEQQFRALDTNLVSDLHVAYFKLAHIGSSLIERTDGAVKAIADAVDGANGYYLVCDDPEKLKETMHDFVNRMLEKAYEQK